MKKISNTDCRQYLKITKYILEQDARGPGTFGLKVKDIFLFIITVGRRRINKMKNQEEMIELFSRLYNRFSDHMEILSALKEMGYSEKEYLGKSKEALETLCQLLNTINENNDLQKMTGNQAKLIEKLLEKNKVPESKEEKTL